jgi:hypothetical protein
MVKQRSDWVILIAGRRIEDEPEKVPKANAPATNYPGG